MAYKMPEYKNSRIYIGNKWPFQLPNHALQNLEMKNIVECDMCL